MRPALQCRAARAAAPAAPAALRTSARSPALRPLTLHAEAAFPAQATVAAEATYAVDARAMAAAWAVARVLWQLDGALVVVCDMRFGRCHWCLQHPPRPHSGPETPKGAWHCSQESREHSPRYLDQKASCGEKGLRQGPLSALVPLRGAHREPPGSGPGGVWQPLSGQET